jgi:hypothetical protein
MLASYPLYLASPDRLSAHLSDPDSQAASFRSLLSFDDDAAAYFHRLTSKAIDPTNAQWMPR